jgi:hypothetical protein
LLFSHSSLKELHHFQTLKGSTKLGGNKFFRNALGYAWSLENVYEMKSVLDLSDWTSPPPSPYCVSRADFYSIR